MIEPEVTVRSSSLPEYADCARRWAAKQMKGEISEAGFQLRETMPSIGAAVGTGTHAGIGHSMIKKMETGELGNATEAEQCGVQALEEQVVNGALWDEITPRLGDAQRQVARMTAVYRQTLAPQMKPVDVERRLKAVHETGLIVSGQTDLIVVDPADLVDYKTGRVQRANFGQYGTYSRLRRTHGRPVTGIKEHFIPRVPVGRSQPNPIIVDYDLATCEAQAEMTLKRIARDVADWRRSGDIESFLPNPNSQLCSEKFCSAFGTAFCRAHKGAKS